MAQGDKITKKIRRDQPKKDSFGQYTYRNGQPKSNPPSNHKFFDRDLYSTIEVNDVNEAVLNTAGDIDIQGDSYIRIDMLEIENTGVSYGLMNNKFQVYVTDNIDFANPEWQGDYITNDLPTGEDLKENKYIDTDTTFDIIDDFFDNAPGTKIFSKSVGKKGSGYDPGVMIDNVVLFTGLFNEPETYKYLEDYQSDYVNASADLDDRFKKSINIDPLGGAGGVTIAGGGVDLYIIVKMQGDARRGGMGVYWKDERDVKIQVFKIKLNDVVGDKAIPGSDGVAPINKDVVDVFYDLTSDDAITKTQGGGFSAVKAAYQVKSLKVAIRRSNEKYAGGNYNTPVSEFIIRNQVEFENEFSNQNYDGILHSRPNQIIAWNRTPITHQSSSGDTGWYDFDFYPGTHIGISSNSQLENSIDLQTYYTDDNDKFIASTPTTIKFDFKIYQPTKVNMDLVPWGTYDTVNETTSSLPPNHNENLKFKFFVVDWNDKDNKIASWQALFSVYPNNMDDFITRQQDTDTFILKEIKWNSGDYITTPSPLTHTYLTPGIKNIKSVIFSYIQNTNGGALQAVRWKLVTSRIYLGKSKSHMEDFSDIGGADFVTLPWPNRTAIISGISQESQYMNSLKSALADGNLSETDIIDESKLVTARDNDELGDYIGDSDLEQTRVFNKPYSMAELLMIDDHITTAELASHTDDTYWDLDGDGIGNTFPTESCVGLIFINDNMDFYDPDNYHKDKRDNCIIEFNAQELEGDVVRDSSGNGNKGILIGDYKIDKPSKDIPIRRKTEPKISDRDSENGAI